MSNKETLLSSAYTLGILGGGQLGKMLLYQTQRFDLRTAVLDPSAVAPGRIGSHHFTQGDLQDFQAVLDFGRKADLVTIEIENVEVDALRALEKEGIAVYPQARVLEIIQNKVRQKEFYQRQQLPTAGFTPTVDREAVRHLLKSGTYRYPAVWKAARGGYDGKGVQILHEEADLAQLPEKAEGLLEEAIAFEQEIAVVVARSQKGEIKCYPPVAMEFHPTANLVEYVLSPAGLAEPLERQALQLAEAVAEAFQIVGLLAVEMFVDKQGSLWINEVAPRVHNSGHLSIEGHVTNQFEQHLRAILGWPLGDTGILRPAVMVNLTGEPGHQGPVYYEGLEEVLRWPGVFPHIYGKAETRPFRKMGHVTITAATLAEARQRAEAVKNTLKVKSL